MDSFKVDIRKIASVPGAILMTPTPIDLSKPHLPETVDDALYAQAVRDVAAEVKIPLVDVNAYVLALPNWQTLLVDGVHPSSALYASIYAQVVPVVQAKVDALACR